MAIGQHQKGRKGVLRFHHSERSTYVKNYNERREARKSLAITEDMEDPSKVTRSPRLAKYIVPEHMLKDIPNELIKETFVESTEYLYRLLDLSDKDLSLTAEEVQRERQRQLIRAVGPRANNLFGRGRAKLTSADALYVLVSTEPSNRLALTLNVSKSTIDSIRSEDTDRYSAWSWERDFYRRLCKKVRKGVTDKVNKDLNKVIVYELRKIILPLGIELTMDTLPEGIPKYEAVARSKYLHRLEKLRVSMYPIRDNISNRREYEKSQLNEIHFPIVELDLI